MVGQGFRWLDFDTSGASATQSWGEHMSGRPPVELQPVPDPFRIAAVPVALLLAWTGFVVCVNVLVTLVLDVRTLACLPGAIEAGWIRLGFEGCAWTAYAFVAGVASAPAAIALLVDRAHVAAVLMLVVWAGLAAVSPDPSPTTVLTYLAAAVVGVLLRARLRVHPNAARRATEERPAG